jgi:hypothetical protein
MIGGEPTGKDSTAAAPSQPMPTLSQPQGMPSQTMIPQYSTDAPLYVLPFGTHKGKTLREVPENYLAFLCVSDDMAASMPGLGKCTPVYGSR